MSCCGSKRLSLLSNNPPTAELQTVSPKTEVSIRYTGLRGLRVRGSVSGQTYLFAQTGAEISVDARDAAGLMGEPDLVRV